LQKRTENGEAPCVLCPSFFLESVFYKESLVFAPKMQLKKTKSCIFLLEKGKNEKKSNKFRKIY